LTRDNTEVGIESVVNDEHLSKQWVPNNETESGIVRGGNDEHP
jgi:hypothetical protein